MSLNDVTRWLDERRDWCFDALRCYLGIGLFVKGIQFASNPELLPAMLTDTGTLSFWSTTIAHYVITAHLVGGTMMVLGFFTRIAAIVQVPALIGAVFFVHAREGLFLSQSGSFEFSTLVLVLLLLNVWHGSGRWSLDYYIRKHDREREEARKHENAQAPAQGSEHSRSRKHEREAHA